MTSQNIQIEIMQQVAIATLTNPPANALSLDLRYEFCEKLSELAQNDDVRVLVITGSGEKFFAAGANIPELLDLDRDGGLARVRKAREFYSSVAEFEKPVICAINGICMGGGLELALACDIRMAAEHVKLGFPEVNLGLIPGAGGTQRLPRAVGPGWANYLIFTGEAISAQEALTIGLLQAVVPSQQLIPEALKIADKIKLKGPLAVRAAKKASVSGLQEKLGKGLDIENEAFADICATADKNEGITAFLEKRKPQFKGK